MCKKWVPSDRIVSKKKNNVLNENKTVSLIQQYVMYWPLNLLPYSNTYIVFTALCIGLDHRGESWNHDYES